MRSQGRNVTNLRTDNRRLILEYLNEVGESSRIKIAKELGLTKASLTIMVNQMLEEGIVYEAGEVASTRVGRKEVRIAINPSYGKVLGISLEKNVVDITIANIRAEVIDHRECKEEDYEKVISKLIEEHSTIKLVGITYYGNDKPKAESLSETLKDMIDVPVLIEHNVAALTEAHQYISHMKDFIFLKYGPGIGSAVVINGTLVKNYESGIGNVNVCGERLEDLISYNAFKNRLNEDVSTSNVAKLYAESKEVRDDILEKMNMVMEAVLNASHILGVKNVVIYGYIFENDILFDALKGLEHGRLEMELTPLIKNKISIAAVYHALYKGFMMKGGII